MIFWFVILSIVLTMGMMTSGIGTGQHDFTKNVQPKIDRTIFVFITAGFAFGLGLVVRYLYERM